MGAAAEVCAKTRSAFGADGLVPVMPYAGGSSRYQNDRPPGIGLTRD